MGLRRFEDAIKQLGSATTIGTDVDTRFTYVNFSYVLVHGEHTPDGQPHCTGRSMIATATIADVDDNPGFDGLYQR